jgi:uncharacterized protein (TIGR00645 family)
MNRIGRAIEIAVFQSRWLVVPFLLGLILGLGALAYTFAFKLAAFVMQGRLASEEEVIVGVLKLVDLSLTANLLLIVICSSYQNFVARIDPADYTNWPEGLGSNRLLRSQAETTQFNRGNCRRQCPGVVYRHRQKR